MPPEMRTAQRDVAPEAAELLRLLADPTRRRIFLALMRGEYCNCELSAELGLQENLVSHHVRKLKEAGLVEEHRDPADARWTHLKVDRGALGAAMHSLVCAFGPALAGDEADRRCRERGQPGRHDGRPVTQDSASPCATGRGAGRSRR